MARNHRGQDMGPHVDNHANKVTARQFDEARKRMARDTGNPIKNIGALDQTITLEQYREGNPEGKPLTDKYYPSDTTPSGMSGHDLAMQQLDEIMDFDDPEKY